MSTVGNLMKQLECFRDEIAREYNNGTLWEYLTNLDIYDCKFTVELGRKGLDYRSVRVMLACGGPNVYLDTEEGALLGFWGSDKETLYLDRDIVEELNDFYEDYYNCCK